MADVSMLQAKSTASSPAEAAELRADEVMENVRRNREQAEKEMYVLREERDAATAQFERREHAIRRIIAMCDGALAQTEATVDEEVADTPMPMGWNTPAPSPNQCEG